MTEQRVLIVDDSSTVRQQLRQLLESNGYYVAEAASGAFALAELHAKPFDLIITDFNMPLMTGAELVRRVRELERYQRTPIFILTTESANETARLGKEAGATAWVVKPWKAESLLSGIRMVLGASGLRRQGPPS